MTRATRRWVYPFGAGQPQAAEADKDLLGGKGASLAAMSLAGLPVPPGFTITTECCRAFFDGGQHWPTGLEEQVREHLDALEQAAGRRFGRGPRPLLVSVRSGAAASMPGMMDTLLNCGLHPGLAEEIETPREFWAAYLQFIPMFARTVAGIPAEVFAAVEEKSDPQTAGPRLAQCYLDLYGEKAGRPFPTEPWTLLVECIDSVFRSWNTPRAVAYRQRHGFDGPWGTAVNVQAMFPSQVSGILFTQDPNRLTAGQIILEASYGLGEAVVSGDVTPDRYTVKRDDLGSCQLVLGNKSRRVTALGDTLGRDPGEPSLTPPQVAEVCKIGLEIEAHFGQPMDIEWGWADGRFALLQCRPIRGLDVAGDQEAGRQAEIARLRTLADGRRRVWVAHNLGETLRAPMPLTWSIVGRFMSGSGGFGRLYQDFGYRPSARVCRDGFLELIGGRIYADPDRVAQLFFGDRPVLRYDGDALVKDSSLLERAPTRFDLEKTDGTLLLRLPGTIRGLLRASRLTRRARKTVLARFEQEALPPYLEYVKRKREEDLGRLGTVQLCAELGQRAARVLDEFGKESLKPGFFGGSALGDLMDLLEPLLGPEDGSQLACTLTAGLEGDTTAAQNQMLYEVARGTTPIEHFLDAYGHRAIGEMELAQPRWREDPQALRQPLATMRRGGRSPEEIHREQTRRRLEAEKELPDLLVRLGGSSFREEIEAALREARTLLPYRESGKHYLMMGYELLRQTVLELGRRWELGRDVFFLDVDELDRYEQESAALRQRIARRKVRWQALQRLDMPDVIDSKDLDRLGLPREYAAAAELSGDPVSAGVATGTARIVRDPAEAGDLGAEFILVCPSTDPGWTSLLVNARGLIVERGGVLSHGAIVARDFGIPAVVCPDATSRLRDGARIRLDGSRGVICVLDGT